jgi:hypothetical protein
MTKEAVNATKSVGLLRSLDRWRLGRCAELVVGRGAQLGLLAGNKTRRG